MTIKDILKKLGAKEMIPITLPAHTIQFTGDNGGAIFEALKEMGLHEVRRGAKFVSWSNYGDGTIRNRVRVGDYVVVDILNAVGDIPELPYVYAMTKEAHSDGFVPAPRKRKK